MVAPVVPYVIRSRSGGYITVDPRVGYTTNAKRKSELGELMNKASKVINSVETIAQHRAARRYTDLVVRRVKEYYRGHGHGFSQFAEVLSYIRALEQDLSMKLNELVERELV